MDKHDFIKRTDLLVAREMWVRIINGSGKTLNPGDIVSIVDVRDDVPVVKAIDDMGYVSAIARGSTEDHDLGKSGEICLGREG